MKLVVLSLLLALFTPASAWLITPIELNSADPQWRWQHGLLWHHNTPFSGWVKQQDASGFEISRFTSGRLNGEQRRYYSDGQLRSQRFFTNGLKTGTHRSWWPNGNPQFEYHFIADRHHGSAYNWHSNGQLASLFNYEHGYEKGAQQLWFDDGRLRAQYQMINGRRYGWMGSKLCQ